MFVTFTWRGWRSASQGALIWIEWTLFDATLCLWLCMLLLLISTPHCCSLLRFSSHTSVWPAFMNKTSLDPWWKNISLLLSTIFGACGMAPCWVCISATGSLVAWNRRWQARSFTELGISLMWAMRWAKAAPHCLQLFYLILLWRFLVTQQNPVAAYIC